ncbi:hypothetical protein [Rhizobium sp. PAMB 3182]
MRAKEPQITLEGSLSRRFERHDHLEDLVLSDNAEEQSLHLGHSPFAVLDIIPENFAGYRCSSGELVAG